MKVLSSKGWKIGLRFDPLIYSENWNKLYSELFEDCLSLIDNKVIHSVSFGPLRFPKQVFKKIKAEQPENKLFMGPLGLQNGIVAYEADLENEMIKFCENKLLNEIEREKIFRCSME